MNLPLEDFEQRLASTLDSLADDVQLDGPMRPDVQSLTSGSDRPSRHLNGSRPAFVMAMAAALILGLLAAGRVSPTTWIEPVTGGAPTSEVVVWLEVGTTDTEAARIQQEIDGRSEVAWLVYYDAEASYAEFVEFFADEPEVLDVVSAESVPTSFHVVLVGDPAPFARWIETFEPVDTVDLAPES